MIKKLYLLLLLVFTCIDLLPAQDFVTRGKIEFEVKRNTKKMFGDNRQNSIVYAMPDVDISYQELLFSGNQSIYMPGRTPAIASMFQSTAQVFINLDKKQAIVKNRIVEEDYVYEDSLKKVKWKIQNETRKIAGWECRKAVGVIYDSVYVVAFYCPEIVPQCGPELFTGLPGMILGVAIPRYYTTWFATKVELANLDEAKVVPPSVKKNKQYPMRELAAILFKKYKDLGWKDMTLENVIQSISAYMLQ